MVIPANSLPRIEYGAGFQGAGASLDCLVSHPCVALLREYAKLSEV